MSLSRKLHLFLFVVLFLGVFSSSFFLVRASVEDKKNYIFDLQTSNGILLVESLGQDAQSFDDELIKQTLVEKARALTGLATMNLGLYKYPTRSWNILTSDNNFKWPESLPERGIEKGVVGSFHFEGWIYSVVPINSQISLVLMSKDDPVIQMITIYLKRTIPIIFIIFLFASFMGWLFSRKVTLPLEQLSQSTEKLGSGQWNINTPISSTKEIQTLASAFKKMGSQLELREQELLAKERLSTLGRFGAGIAHELKNPLNVISSYAQLLQRNLPNDMKSLSQIEVIHSEVKRATEIINNLLSFSRQKSLNIKEFSGKDFIVDVVERQKTTHDTNIVWDLEVEEGLILFADADHLKQVITNLIDNATQSFGPEQKESKISIKVYQKTNFTKIEIRDSGLGISAVQLPHIFEPFFTSKEVGKGTGLGLAFCKGIISQHNGEIEVVSQKGQGCQFIISLPRSSRGLQT